MTTSEKSRSVETLNTFFGQLVINLMLNYSISSAVIYYLKHYTFDQERRDDNTLVLCELRN